MLLALLQEVNRQDAEDAKIKIPKCQGSRQFALADLDHRFGDLGVLAVQIFRIVAHFGEVSQ
jgi:hypothetical protein